MTRSSTGSIFTPSDVLGDDVGPRHLQLVAFAPHHLDENGQLQLAAADHLHLFRRCPCPRLAATRCRAARESSRSRRFRDVTYWPSRPAIGDVLTPKIIDTVGSSTGMRGMATRCSGLGDRLADRDVLDAGETDDVAGGRLLDLHALQAVEHEQLGDPCLLGAPVELQHRHRVVQADRAVEDARRSRSGRGSRSHRDWRPASEAATARSPRGGGTCSTIASNSGPRSLPVTAGSPLATPVRAFVYSTGNSIWSSVASRSMKRS